MAKFRLEFSCYKFHHLALKKNEYELSCSDYCDVKTLSL